MKTHQNCKDCGHSGCLTEWDNGNTYCHSCGVVRSHATSDDGHLPELKHKIVSYRGITKSTAEFYNILTGFDGEREVTRVYPYPHAIKTRVLPKDFSHNKGFTNSYLFGCDKFNPGSSKVLTIVEGEEDTPSAYQMLGGKWPVVGVPGNAGAKSVLKNREMYEYINSFDQIVVVLDNDGGAGAKLGNDISRAFPNRTYAVHLSLFKDSNDYLVNRKEKEFINSWFNRQKYTPDNVLNTAEQFLSLYRDTPDHLYVPTGIEALDEKIKGIMRGYFTVLKAATGIGKTEVMRRIEFSMLERGTPIAVWHLEETKLRSLLGLVSYQLNDNLTRKDVIEEKGKSAEVEKGIKELTKGELLYQFFMRDGDTSDDLVDQIRYFAEVCDVKYIFVEPIQDIIVGTGDSKESMLAELAVRLSKLAAELNIAIVTIAHTNDDGEIKYCRMIGQRAGIIIRLDRNRTSEDEVERNTTWLTIEKNRPMSVEGFAGCLEFNPDTFTIEEREF